MPDATHFSVNRTRSNGFCCGAWTFIPYRFSGILRNHDAAGYADVPVSDFQNAGPYWSSIAARFGSKADARQWCEHSEISGVMHSLRIRMLIALFKKRIIQGICGVLSSGTTSLTSQPDHLKRFRTMRVLPGAKCFFLFLNCTRRAFFTSPV